MLNPSVTSSSSTARYLVNEFSKTRSKNIQQKDSLISECVIDAFSNIDLTERARIIINGFNHLNQHNFNKGLFARDCTRSAMLLLMFAYVMINKKVPQTKIQLENFFRNQLSLCQNGGSAEMTLPKKYFEEYKPQLDKINAEQSLDPQYLPAGEEHHLTVIYKKIINRVNEKLGELQNGIFTKVKTIYERCRVNLTLAELNAHYPFIGNQRFNIYNKVVAMFPNGENKFTIEIAREFKQTIVEAFGQLDFIELKVTENESTKKFQLEFLLSNNEPFAALLELADCITKTKKTLKNNFVQLKLAYITETDQQNKAKDQGKYVGCDRVLADFAKQKTLLPKIDKFDKKPNRVTRENQTQQFRIRKERIYRDGSLLDDSTEAAEEYPRIVQEISCFKSEANDRVFHVKYNVYRENMSGVRLSGLYSSEAHQDVSEFERNNWFTALYFEVSLQDDGSYIYSPCTTCPPSVFTQELSLKEQRDLHSYNKNKENQLAHQNSKAPYHLVRLNEKFSFRF